MGQYYHPTLLEKNQKTVLSWFFAHEYLEGLTLIETCYLKNHFVGAVESMLLNQPHHVVWAGDYADKCKGLENNIYERCTEETKVNPIDFPPTLVKEMFIVNHTTKQFIDKTKVPTFNGGWQFHPLPFMTCEGNGRGGGDFYGEDKDNIIGSWARHLISIEKNAPGDEYKEVAFNIVENVSNFL